MLYDLQLFVDEYMPEAFIGPKGNEGENLVRRKDDMSAIQGTFEMFREPATD